MNTRVDSSRRFWNPRTPSLEWLLRTDLDSLRSNLSDDQPILNQVECLLYLSRRHLEEAARQGKMPANVVGKLQEEYKGLRQLAHQKFPALVEYWASNG